MNRAMNEHRREFLKLGAAALAAAVAPPAFASVERPPIPYVDGLSFLTSDPDDVGRSGLTALILDVSSVSQVKTDDGSVKYFRSFEACAESMTAMRRSIAAGARGKTFLATRGADVDRAFGEGRTAVFFQMQGGNRSATGSNGSTCSTSWACACSRSPTTTTTRGAAAPSRRRGPG